MSTTKAKQQLSRDFDKLLKDARVLLEATAGEVDGKTAQARRKLKDSLGAAEEAVREAVGDVEVKVREHAATADDYVRANPWQAVGASFVIGLLAGWLTSRR